MDPNILNIKCVSVQCLYVLSNTEVTFEAQFIKTLSNGELKKSIAYKKGMYCVTE